MSETGMTPEAVQALFTRADGTYAFARWGRPIAPVVFGVEDETLSVIKGALEAWCASALVQAPCCEELHPHPRCLAAQRGSLLTSSASSSRGSS